jgi:hypothetical protein
MRCTLRIIFFLALARRAILGQGGWRRDDEPGDHQKRQRPASGDDG